MSLSNPLDLSLLTDAQASKHVTLNNGLLKLSQALGNRLEIDLTAGNATVIADTAQRNYFINLVGAAVSGREVSLPAKNRTLLIASAAANAHDITLTIVGGSDTVVLVPGSTALVITSEVPTLEGFFLAQTAVVSNFTDLSDTPANFSGAGNKLVAVNAGATALEFIDAPAPESGATELSDLTDVVVDTPNEGDLLSFNDVLGVFVNIPIASLGGATLFSQLLDVEVTAPSDGDIIIWNNDEEKWENKPPALPLLTIVTETDDRTLVLGDAGKYIRMASSDANVVTIPNNSSVAIPVGSQIAIVQAGVGETSISADSGVTINSTETLTLRKQFSAATLTKVDTNTWDAIGDFEEDV